MHKLSGIAVSPGVAMGEALVTGNEGFRIPRRFVTRDSVDYELDRLARAIEDAGKDIARNRDLVQKESATRRGDLRGPPADARRRAAAERPGGDDPPAALLAGIRRQPQIREYAQVFEKVQSRSLGDIFDIEKQLLRKLLGRRREELSKLRSPVLILANNLTPSEAANLDRRFVRGFATEIGGPGSHTAIVAAGMAIPAVVGTGPFSSEVSGGDFVIIDGDKGLVILQPDEETIAHYRHEAKEHRHVVARLETLRDLPAGHLGRTEISLFGNIEFPYEGEHCVDRGADGVGLYRTEFLYLGREQEPSEEEHFQVYSRVIRGWGPAGDHPHVRPRGRQGPPPARSRGRAQPGPRPAEHPAVAPQPAHVPPATRAILRASALGKVRVMFPLISTLLEFRQARMVLADVMEDLNEHKIAFDAEMPVGMMVEVPAAAMMIDNFVDEVDFLSIGTNDLIQYTLAVDRNNKEVVWLYNASEPAVLKLIDVVLRAAKRKGVPVSLCGQMSGVPLYTMLLLGMGLRELSVPPGVIPEIKSICRSVAIDRCEEVAKHALTLEHARDVTSYLREELRKSVPESGP